ncbi:MAG: hypothetical protein AAB883_01455 [Patescibacteria group bacterium]
MAQSFMVTGDRAAGISAARAYGTQVLGLPEESHPDVLVLEYHLFPVEHAREVMEVVSMAPVAGSDKLVIIATERIFHEAQNALLKLFEEPPPYATLVLLVPQEGQLLPTLRSRLQSLPRHGAPEARTPHPFVLASTGEREKMVAKLLDRAKSAKDDEKQSARADALRIIEGLTIAHYEKEKEGTGSEENRMLLSELSRFTSILHERSAPLKLIFEHLLLVLPTKR